ncbi:MAG: 30S ribosomal protein S16 [Solirubrobacterales bacterium]|nr:30S ribosomal protein S16 [Solirubrobacterales bacterium]
MVGTYDPRREPSAVTVDNDKAVGWLQKGAQPSERVAGLLRVKGIKATGS